MGTKQRRGPGAVVVIREAQLLAALRYRRDLIADVRQRGAIPTLGELRAALIFGESPETPACSGCEAQMGMACLTPSGMHYARRNDLVERWRARRPLPLLPTQEGVEAAMRSAGFFVESVTVRQLWAEVNDLSWDADNECPEPVCGGCGIPINVADGEEGCPDCWDCTECCEDNHAGEPHAPGGGL